MEGKGKVSFGPLVSAGVVMGAGLGGFVDGIVLHQIMQWHNMLSARTPPDTLVNAKINMVWDGFFHAGVWIMTAIGLAMLFRAGGRKDVPWSGRTFFGSLLIGWALFNLVEGIIDHHILRLHHVYEYASADSQAVFDYGFLLIGGVILGSIGLAIVKSGKRTWNRDVRLGAGVAPEEGVHRSAYLK
jgi:uncharacterized membrane protein